MNTPTLSQLADIGAKAAKQTLAESCLLCVSEESGFDFKADAPAREAFVKAVLDAVGYKFPVDPGREAFRKWLARQSSDGKPDLFTAWQAGKASRTTTEPNAPETFELNGHMWNKFTPHTADSNRSQVLLLTASMEAVTQVISGLRTIAWRYADAKPAPETFEAHGLTWFKHTPGDPMPCDGEAEVQTLWRSELPPNKMISPDTTDKAIVWDWGRKGVMADEAIGWRYATPPADTP